MKFNLQAKYKAVVIGGSAGSFQPITKILETMPPNFPLPIILCLHRLKHVRHGFVEALSIKSQKSIEEPYDKQPIKRGMVYLAPANYHLMVELGNSFTLSTDELVNNSRPSIDVTFESVAFAFKEKAIGILLSGANKDGANGMAAIKARNGLTIIQDLEESMIATMPASALEKTTIDYVLKTEQIIRFFNDLDKIYQKEFS